MTSWVESFIPVIVIFVMVIVGTDLRFADFQRVRRYPILVPGIVIGQWVLLTVVAGSAGYLLDLPPTITGGAILFAAAPVAALSGYYTQLANGHLALAVTVAAISNLLAAIFTPLAASVGFWYFLGSNGAMELPVLKIALQTVIGLLLPLLAGMLLRHFASNWIARWRGLLQGISLIAIFAMLGFVIFDQFPAIRAQFGLLFSVSIVLTLAMLAVGFLSVKLVVHASQDRRALIWGFPARNVGIATLAATSVMGQMAVASFIAVLFTTQVILLVPLALWLRAHSRNKCEPGSEQIAIRPLA